MAKARACMCANKGRQNCPHHAHVDTTTEEERMSIKMIKELIAGPKVLKPGPKVKGNQKAQKQAPEKKAPIKPPEPVKPQGDTKETKEGASENTDEPKEDSETPEDTNKASAGADDSAPIVEPAKKEPSKGKNKRKRKNGK